jgi:anaerobic magnesium-protoporphyrin IX monomethyl ester cyclase
MSAPRLKVAFVGVNMPRYRSLGLAYVRSYAGQDPRLTRVGMTTLDLDTTVDPWWIAYRALALEPDVIAFSVMCWNARSVFEAARLIRGAPPATRIVLGGPEVGPIAEAILAEQPAVDAVVRGEGEETFADLLDALLAGRDLSRVPGVTARRGDRVVSAPDRPLVADLDSLPSPYLTGVLAPVEGATYLETYRGCPHRCAYCFEGKGYGRVRRFSDERVRAEIEAVLSAGVRTFSFIDPVFNLTRERLAWLADVLAPHARAGVRLHTVEVDIERIDDEAAVLLARCGVASVETGPQSVGAAALAACSRSFDPDRFRAGVEALRRRGISVESDLIVGLPGDTAADVLAGMRFALSADPGTIQMSTLHVLPGTQLWERAEELGLEFDRVAPHEVVRTPDLSFADLRRLEVLGTAMQSAYRARLTER